MPGADTSDDKGVAKTSVKRSDRDLKHKLWYNEVQGFAYMQLVGELSRDDILTLFSVIDEVFVNKPNHNLIIDVRLSPGMVPDKVLRDLFRERAIKTGLDRISILGADPASRMMFKVLISVLGKTAVTRFCDSEREALAWLREDISGGER